MKQLTIEEFILKLNLKELEERKTEEATSVMGVIIVPENAEFFFFSSNCQNWVSLKRELVQGIEFIKYVNCNGNELPLVRLAVFSQGIPTMVKHLSTSPLTNKTLPDKGIWPDSWRARCWRCDFTTGCVPYDFAQSMARDHERWSSGWPGPHITYLELCNWPY